MVTDELLQEFKDRMKITHSIEDDNLKRLLSFSIADLKAKSGDFDVSDDSDLNKRAKELVFERTRFAYNDALEHFDKSFLTDIHSLGIDLAGGTDEEV